MSTTHLPLVAGLACWLSPMSSRVVEGKISETPSVLARSAARMPLPVTSFGAATLDGWCYVVGGHFGAPHEYDARTQSNVTWRFPACNPSAWQVLVQDQRGVQSSALVACRGSIIRLGGMVVESDGNGDDSLRSLTEVERLDVDSRTWVALPSLPVPRSSHAAVSLDGRVYVVGGWSIHGEMGRQSLWHSDLWSFDPAQSGAQWERVPFPTSALPLQRRGLAAAAVNGRIVVVGGMDPQGEPTHAVEVIDVASGTITRGPDLPEEGFGACALAFPEAVVVSLPSGKLWRWRMSESKWEQVAEASHPRRFHQLLGIGPSELLVLGGTCAKTRAARIERLELDALPGENVASMLLPNPGVARNRQALAILGESLVFAGGNRSLGQHDFAPDDFQDEAWSFNLISLEWTRLAGLPVRRQSLGAFVHDGRAWILGGFGHDGARPRSFEEVFAYEHTARAWKAVVPSLPVPLTQFGIAQRESEIWIVGGLDYAKQREIGNDFELQSSVLKLDVTSPTMGFRKTDLELPAPRRALAAAWLYDRLYVVGGMTDGFRLVEECFVRDAAASAWETLPAPHRARASPELVAAEGKLYLAGGVVRGADGELAADRSLEVYDPEEGRWRILIEDIPVPAQHVRMLAYRSQLLLVSTSDPEGLLHIAWINVGQNNEATEH
jgi:N-acetylneuraminic acid mutarotase